MRSQTVVILNRRDRDELELRRRSRSARADDVQRARLILMLADGETFDVIQEKLDCSRTYITRWKSRFLQGGLASLYGRHRGRKVSALTPAVEARILAATKRKPEDGSTHWSTRRLAAKLGVSHMLVHRAWARAGIKPHRICAVAPVVKCPGEENALDVAISLVHELADHRIAVLNHREERKQNQAAPRREEPRTFSSQGTMSRRSPKIGFECVTGEVSESP